MVLIRRSQLGTIQCFWYLGSKGFPTHFIKSNKPDIKFHNVFASESIIPVSFMIYHTQIQLHWLTPWAPETVAEDISKRIFE